MLLDALKIEIAHTKELPPGTDLLITVDCQRGAGNVFKYELPEKAEVFVIDHHRHEIPEDENTIIRPELASCATVVWAMLTNEGYAMDNRVRNALYYGLFTDTNGLSELRHPLDRDLADLLHDAGLIKKLRNAAITLDELDIIGGALRDYEVLTNIGLFKARPCDPNLLGFTSDIAQQVADMECCVIYCEMPHGLKLSIRASAREVMASEIAGFLCRDTGSGGGALDKAGGFMSYAKIAEKTSVPPAEYLKSRILAYLVRYDYIYAGKHSEDFRGMPLYRKLPRPVGFVPSTDVFPAGTKITIRTLEGDVDTVTDSGVYLMIGIQGEVYPIKQERFEASYTVPGEPYHVETEYIPAILNRFTSEKKGLLPYAKTCVPKDSKLIRARVLTKDTKVFTYWDTERYYHGGVGDYLAANEGDYDDCYIVRRDIFADTYERCD
jgi:phosphoglycolate phosphatase